MTTTAQREGERGGADRRLDRYFDYRARGSSLRTEVVAGLTTFMTMAYILFLNPSILGAVADPGGRRLPAGAVLTVTALVAGAATLAMGLWANYPFALAAGLGINGVVAFTFVAGQGLSWAEAMGLIVLEGLIITVLVLTGLREAVLDAIPMALKKAIGVGIGLFIAFIGFYDAGFVVRPQSPATPVALATINGLKVTVFIVGLLLTVALVAVFAVMLSDFFDTMGTVIGLGDEAGLLDRNGRLPKINRVLVVDSLAA